MAAAPVDALFQAFADETRLRLLHLLKEEACVGDLVAILGLPQPTISRHLAHLRNAGMVTVRKRGLWRFYVLARARNGVHRKLIDCLDSCLTEVPILKADARKAARLRREGGCCPR